MHRDRILLVDADPVSCGMLMDHLRSDGFEVDAVLPAARDEIIWQRFALLLLYVSGDIRDDVALLSWLRAARGRTSALVVSSQGAHAARRCAFELGALDYMTELTDMRELVARVRAALHRCHSRREDAIRDINDLFNEHWAVAVRAPDHTFAPTDITLTDST